MAVGGSGSEAAAPPAFVGEIPGDGFIQAGLKGFAREKAQLGFHAGGVDGVAAIVAWAIIEFFVCLFPLIIYLIYYALQPAAEVRQIYVMEAARQA